MGLINISIVTKRISLIRYSIISKMSLDDELSEFVRDPVDQMDEESVERPAEEAKQRGAPRIPDMWTRVISFSSDNLQQLNIYPISTDLLVEQGYDKTRKRKGEPDWEIHFSPKQYLELHPNPDLERMRISDDRLKRYGEQVSKIRGWILERAT